MLDCDDHSDEFVTKLKVLNQRLKLIREVKKTKRWRRKSPLIKHVETIVTMIEFESASYREVAMYLKKYHRINMTRQNIAAFYQGIKRLAASTKKTEEKDYWGDSGELGK
ncbi:TPA: hypothetical protein I7682_17655 [Vibrio vulnificus]|nr:hypothetical protein [Vibrio vulnificus]